MRSSGRRKHARVMPFGTTLATATSGTYGKRSPSLLLPTSAEWSRSTLGSTLHAGSFLAESSNHTHLAGPTQFDSSNSASITSPFLPAAPPDGAPPAPGGGPPAPGGAPPADS